VLRSPISRLASISAYRALLDEGVAREMKIIAATQRIGDYEMVS
jgi:hypothetical protein